jgi:superfamily II DNA or RNA helicase
MASFRPYQQHAFDAIVNELQNNNKCIVKMFCGSGKSLIMHNIVKHFNLQLSVFVFPSLSLVDQFYVKKLFTFVMELKTPFQDIPELQIPSIEINLMDLLNPNSVPNS